MEYHSSMKCLTYARQAASTILSIAVLAAVPTIASAAGNDRPPVLQTVAPARILVPSIDVDAPIIELGLKPNGEMDAPEGPSPVGWYNFSPTPGNPGNTVMSGHRDWRTGVTGVFWRLNEIRPGDRIAVQLADGNQVEYIAAVSALIGEDEMPISEVVGHTDVETITLISCEGVFNPATHGYDKRRVVWASRAT